MLRLIGLKNCDTCRKAQKWLKDEGVDFNYHDVRADGLQKEDLEKWSQALGWENLLNKRSTTWRTLDEQQRDCLDQNKAISLMIEHPTLMKRPIIEIDGDVLMGFKKEQIEILKTKI